MMRCVVIDDEPYARQLLTEFISRIPDLVMEGAYANPLSALPVLSKKNIDVIFLDIQMPDISGIDFIKTFDRKPSVIFTTAFAEYAIEGFELDVVDYLLKPFDFNRFLKAANKLRQRVGTAPVSPPEKANTPPAFIFVKDGNRLVKVELAGILFIKGTREYVTIHTRDRKIMSLQTLRNLETELPEQFARVHNSYIVNIPSIDVVSKHEIEIAQEIIPIGITYKKSFLEKISRFFPGGEMGEKS
jgi:two-component system, LytTR family, response regulator